MAMIVGQNLMNEGYFQELPSKFFYIFKREKNPNVETL